MSEGKTYDYKLHIFKELNYNRKLHCMLVVAKRRHIINDQNVPSSQSYVVSAVSLSNSSGSDSNKS